MTIEQLIAAVYRDVFSRTAEEQQFYPDNLQAAEFKELAAADVDRYFAPSYRQETNETGYSLSQFKQHVVDIKSRPPAHFSIELLSEIRHGNNTQVGIRVVVTDAASGKVLSLVMSCWEVHALDDSLRIVRNRELTFTPSNPPAADDKFGTLLDPSRWQADITV